MALTTNDQGLIREYLLGRLDEDEQQKIEERLMVEDDLFDEFEASKGELVEQYCAGELSKSERDWFERHYLASEEGRQQYTLAVTLDSKKRPAKPEEPTWFERITLFFKQHPWTVASATAGVLVVMVAGLLLLPGSAQFSVNAPPFVGGTLTSKTINREGGDLPKRITLPADAPALSLRLLLPQPSTPGASYRANLDTRTEEKPVIVITSDAESVTVVVPASLLRSGEFGLTLTAINSDGTEQKIPGQYLFNID